MFLRHDLAVRQATALDDGMTTDRERIERLVALLTECREACLFAEDDGRIGVTEDPHIPADLFSRICDELNK